MLKFFISKNRRTELIIFEVVLVQEEEPELNVDVVVREGSRLVGVHELGGSDEHPGNQGLARNEVENLDLQPLPERGCAEHARADDVALPDEGRGCLYWSGDLRAEQYFAGFGRGSRL